MEAEATAMMGASSDIDRLSYEIFSILESKFLFGYGDQFLFRSGQPETLLKAAIACPKASTAGKIRVLCIDEGPGIVAAVALAHLEIALAKQCGNPAARISDFFDLAAGSGTGGVLAAMLFTRAPDGRPLFSAGEALQFTLKNRRKFASSRKKGVFHRSGGIFRRVFGESTLRDAIKPVLIPCFDLATGAPFLFSRADAVEADAFDFPMRDVCAATCAGKASAEMRSVDGRTRIRAVGGVVAMRNPTAAAITHVLNNKLEFPFAAGVEDLLVVSLGGGEGVAAPPSAAELVRIASEGAVDMVDQAVALAFGQSIAASYFRIQGILPEKRRTSPSAEAVAAEGMLSQRSVVSVMFRGRKLSEKTNGERLELCCVGLMAEHERRKRSTVTTVLIKPAVTPRTSSATSSTSLTVTSTSTAPSVR